MGLPWSSLAQKIQSKFLRAAPPQDLLPLTCCLTPSSYCATRRNFHIEVPSKSQYLHSFSFVLVKFKHGRRCIRVIETFFRLRCSNILCLPRFFVPCDIQTFPGSAKKDKYLRSSLFVMMMILMRRTVILMILIHSSRRDDKWSQISSL